GRTKDRSRIDWYHDEPKTLAKLSLLLHNSSNSSLRTTALHTWRTTMKTGMNLLLWSTHVTAEHFPILAKLKKAGFDGVEVPLFEGDANHFKSIRKELDNQGLGCTTVTVVGPDANPISPDASVRKA